MALRLVPPSAAFRASFVRALEEFQREGLPWWRGGDIELAVADFDAFVARKLGDHERTHRWAIANGEFVGRLSIHHELTDELRIVGGHIGYDTVPSFRGRGFATEMLRQALPIAKSLGLTEVLITCDDDNDPSIRVIEKNGGVLRRAAKIEAAPVPKRYYWIDVAAQVSSTTK